MEHLNYCRQFLKQAEPFLRDHPNLPADMRALVSGAVDLARVSTKFLMPDGGRLFDDLEYRGLDETQPLRLPYPFIAIEYRAQHRPQHGEQPEMVTADGQRQAVGNGIDGVSAPKRIAFARERDGWIVITVVFYTTHDGLWRVLPECALPTTGYLDRGILSPTGRVAIKMGASDKRVLGDVADEAGAVLALLNALSCANVRVEASRPSIKGKALKSAHAFDTYHVLTIGNETRDERTGAVTQDGRRPREHLRRGHIRRYESGLRVWVNATVVNAGVGGTVSKDYRLAA